MKNQALCSDRPRIMNSSGIHEPLHFTKIPQACYSPDKCCNNMGTGTINKKVAVIHAPILFPIESPYISMGRTSGGFQHRKWRVTCHPYKIQSSKGNSRICKAAELFVFPYYVHAMLPLSQSKEKMFTTMSRWKPSDRLLGSPAEMSKEICYVALRERVPHNSKDML
mmetsp:Transcript_146933/g.281659  ORF Transcript_146933/g.281659 Transcript_146933/m.281659 type:complete len:167 (-) Transcript_146933:173-673(-)